MAAPRELDLTVTLDAAWQAWSAHLYARVAADAMSPGTVRGYLSYARKAVDHFGPHRTCDSVEAEEIDAWVGTYRARGCGPATLRFCHKGFGGLLAYAESRRWLRENPMRDVARIPLPAKPPGPERAALTGPEREAMIAAARAGHGTARHGNLAEWMRDEAVIRLAAESGLRNADICNLDLGDLERLPSGDWVVQIRRGKGRKARTTPITDACARLLLTYVADHRPPSGTAPDRRDKHGALRKGDRDALLLTFRGHRLDSSTICNIVGRLARTALGRHYIPHGLRHTAGTLLMREAKADVATVAHVLGHSDISVTSRYLDTSTDEAAAAVNGRRTGSRSRGPKELPPGPAEKQWPECGTSKGWNRHHKERGRKCGPCRMWKRRQNEAREQLLALMPKRAHGTPQGYRDWRCRCEPCCEAVRPKVSLAKKPVPGARKAAPARRPKVSLVKRGQRPVSASQAPRVARGARVSLIKLRERPVAGCGTPAGYQRHRARNEPACRACLDAVSAEQRERRARRREQLTGSREIRPSAAPCGTPGGYKQHRKQGTPPCADCLAAVAAISRERAALGEDTRAGAPVRARGICPECRELRALALGTGGMRRHGDCPGNGQPPAAPEGPARLHLVPPPTVPSPAELLLHRLRTTQEEAS